MFAAQVEFPLLGIVVVLGLILAPLAIVMAIRDRKKLKGILQDAESFMRHKQYRKAYCAYRKYIGISLDIAACGVSSVLVTNPQRLSKAIEKCLPIVDKLQSILQTQGIEYDLSAFRKVQKHLHEMIKDKSLVNFDGGLTRDGQAIFEAIKKKMQDIYVSAPSLEHADWLPKCNDAVRK